MGPISNLINNIGLAIVVAAGGYLTLRAMVVSPDVKAGVIWAGVVASYPDLLTRWRRSSPSVPTPVPGSGRSWRSGWIEQYGTPEENPQFWASVSANTYLGDLSGPLQLHMEYDELGGADAGRRQITIPKEKLLAIMRRDMDVLKPMLHEAGLA